MPNQQPNRQPKHRPKPGVAQDYDDFTWIGTVVNVHGLRGELKVYPQTDTPEYYLDSKSFYIEKSGELLPFEVETIRLHKNLWFIKFKTIDDRTTAEAYRKYRILLKDSDLRPLDDGEYFVYDLVGCEVEDLKGIPLGNVTDILQTGASDIFVVQGTYGEILVPNLPHVVKEVQIEQKRICIDPIPGMIEEE